MVNPRPNSAAANSTAASSQQPAVPISVYRELAAELEQAKFEIAALKGQNQQILRHNQRLRQEADAATQALRTLQRIVSEYDDAGNPLPVNPIPTAPPPTPSQPYAPAPPSESEPSWPRTDFDRDRLVAEVPAEPEPPSRNPESSGDVGGWLLGIAIALIAFTTFGIAFLTIRPLLSGGGNNN